eukprot:TRINITY_DN434_c1_g1_i2.p1 TRINITY_DN434_c1_g1~~TRINITY_DN434_c1_g1_i2.p1  ORF type:complete len:215 (-),score=-9.33 TRINITY_DN434_c1_g1_i2:216-860(-)
MNQKGINYENSTVLLGIVKIGNKITQVSFSRFVIFRVRFDKNPKHHIFEQQNQIEYFVQTPISKVLGKYKQQYNIIYFISFQVQFDKNYNIHKQIRKTLTKIKTEILHQDGKKTKSNLSINFNLNYMEFKMRSLSIIHFVVVNFFHFTARAVIIYTNHYIYSLFQISRKEYIQNPPSILQPSIQRQIHYSDTKINFHSANCQFQVFFNQQQRKY